MPITGEQMNVDLEKGKSRGCREKAYSKTRSEIDSKEFCPKEMEKSKVSILSD